MVSEPTVYNTRTVYDKAGGGKRANLTFRTDQRADTPYGVMFDSENRVYSPPGTTNWSMSTNDEYDLSNATKSIEFTIKWLTTAYTNFNRIWNTDVSGALFYAQLKPTGYLYITLNKSDGTPVYSGDVVHLDLNVEYTARNLLDIENGKFKFYLNNNLLVEENINIPDLNLNTYRPGFGTARNVYSPQTMTSGIFFYLDKISFKIDGIEKIPYI